MFAAPKILWLFAFSGLLFVSHYFLNDSRREFELIATLVDRSSQAQSLDEILQLVTSKVADYFDFTYVNILLHKEGELHLAWSNVKAGREKIGFSVPVDRSSLNGLAALTRAPQVSTDVRSNNAYKWVPFFPDTKCEMAVPLVVADEVIGTLDIQDVRADGFLPHQLRLIRDTLTRSLAVVIGTRLQSEQIAVQARQIQEQTRRIEGIHAAMNLAVRSALLGATPLDVLQKVVEVGQNVMEASNVVAFLMETTNDGFRLVGKPCYHGVFKGGAPNKPENADSAVFRIAEYGRPFFAEDIADPDAITLLGGGSSKVAATKLRFLQREGLRSVAALPILPVDRGETTTRLLGVIFFNFRSYRSFSSSQEREAFETFVRLASLAIDAARRASERQLGELESRWLRMHNLYLNRLLLCRATVRRIKEKSASELLSSLEAQLDDLAAYLRLETEGMRIKRDYQPFPARMKEMVHVLQSSFPDVQFVFELLDPYPSVPSWVDERLENFAREAVVNSLRHAAPKQVWVTWGKTNGEFFVEVVDDGEGFDVQTAPHRSGSEALALEAKALGGVLKTDSGEKGTVVRVVFNPEILTVTEV